MKKLKPIKYLSLVLIFSLLSIINVYGFNLDIEYNGRNYNNEGSIINNSFTGGGNAFDENTSTSATGSLGASDTKASLGRLFGAMNISNGYYNVTFGGPGGANPFNDLDLYYYNGSQWLFSQNLIANESYNTFTGSFNISAPQPIQGIALNLTNVQTGISRTINITEFNFFLVNTSKTIYTNSSNLSLDVYNNQSNTGASILGYTYSGNVTSNPTKNNGSFTGYTTNNGTLVGGVTREENCINSTFGNCVSFDGSTGTIEMGTSALNNESLTMMIWTRVDVSTVSFEKVIGHIDGASDRIYLQSSSTSNRFMWQLGDGVGQATYPVTESLGTWVHFALTLNDGTASIYRNGVYVSNFTYTGLDSFDTTYHLGSLNGAANFYEGAVDEYRVFPYVLTQSEIQAQMNSQNPINQTIASYSFAEDNGTITFDSNPFTQGNSTEDIWNRAIAFNGSQYIKSSATPINSYPISFSGWVKFDNIASDRAIITLGDELTTNEYIGIWKAGSANFRVGGANGGAQIRVTSTTTTNINQWYHVVGVMTNSTHREIWVNGINEANNTDTLTFPTSVDNIGIGVLSLSSDFWLLDGSLDDVTIWNKSLSSSDVSQLFNRTYYNTTGLVASYNAEQIDTSYLYDRNTEFCYNCTNISPTFSLDEGVFSSWFINSFTGQENFLWSYIDLNNPSLSDNLTTEINTYLINLSEYIGYSDNFVGSATCTLNVITSSQITDCSNETFNFSRNGNLSYTIEVIDLAGNSVGSSGVIYVNPNQTFGFINSSGDLIENYTLNGINYSTYAQIPIFDYGYGDIEFNFSKNAYENVSFSVNFNQTSNINQNISVPPAIINFEFIDLETFSLINSTNVTLTLIGSTYSKEFSTTNGTIRIEDATLVPANYTAFASASGYETTSRSFTFSSQEEINISMYLLPPDTNNTADLIVRVIDQDGNPMKNEKVLQYVWDTNAAQYIVINERNTDQVDGETSFPVILESKLYQFCAQINGNLFCETDQVINVNTELLIIQAIRDIDLPPFYVLEGISGNITNSSNSTQHNVTYTFEDSTFRVTQGCLYTYNITGTTNQLISTECVSGSSGGIAITLVGNGSDRFRSYGYVTLNGEPRLIDSKTFYFEDTFDSAVNVEGFPKFIPLIISLAIVGATLNRRVRALGICHIALAITACLAFYFLPSVISFNIAVIILVCNLFMAIILNRRQD